MKARILSFILLTGFAPAAPLKRMSKAVRRSLTCTCTHMPRTRGGLLRYPTLAAVNR
jgi:hypothetical protein